MRIVPEDASKIFACSSRVFTYSSIRDGGGSEKNFFALPLKYKIPAATVC